MTIVETSISIGKPVEQVFEFLTNLQNQTKLNDMLTEVTLSGPVEVGTRFQTKGKVMGRDFSSDNEIIALEPNKKFGIKTFAAPRFRHNQHVYARRRWGRHQINPCNGFGDHDWRRPRHGRYGEKPTENRPRRHHGCHQESTGKLVIQQ